MGSVFALRDPVVGAASSERDKPSQMDFLCLTLGVTLRVGTKLSSFVQQSPLGGAILGVLGVWEALQAAYIRETTGPILA